MNQPRTPYAQKPKVQAIDIAGRTPPWNPDAELAVLSTILLDGSKRLDAVKVVLPTGEPFYADAHQRIYEAALVLHSKGQPVDVATLSAELRDRDRLQAIGGISFLAQIVDKTPSVANVVAHAQIVREKWRIRRAIEAQQMGAAEAYGDYGETQQYLNAVAEKLSAIANDTYERRDPSMLYDVTHALVSRYGQGLNLGVATGLSDVDKKTGGLREGELIVVGARPGMGKTAYVCNIALNVAAEPQQHTTNGVMVFSLEMPKEQLGARMIVSEGRVSLTDFRNEMLSARDFDRMVEAASRIGQFPVWIDDTSAITLPELRAKVIERQRAFDQRAPAAEDGTPGRWLRRIGLVIVDYLQLMRGRDGVTSREQEIAEISRGLKAMAKDLRVPVIALASMNRDVEKRSGREKRPQLADLRESGAIESDADMVQFLYRPEYYITDKESAEAAKLKGYAEVIIAKQRNGPTARIPVTFLDHCTRFENRAFDAYREAEDA